jgi:hypothetical protein
VSRVYFTDRDLARNTFPNALRSAGIHVERHADHFDDEEADEVWLETVVGRGWTVLTMDNRMIRRLTVQEIVMSSRACLLVLGGANAPMAQIAANFINTHPRIERFLHRNEAPLIARIYRPSGGPESIATGEPGAVRLYLDLTAWRRRRAIPDGG